MNEQQLIEAVDDCLLRLMAGESVANCLQRYPLPLWKPRSPLRRPPRPKLPPLSCRRCLNRNHPSPVDAADCRCNNLRPSHVH